MKKSKKSKKKLQQEMDQIEAQLIEAGLIDPIENTENTSSN